MTQAVKDIIINNDFNIVKSRVLHWTRNEAEKFYAEHEGKYYDNKWYIHMERKILLYTLLCDCTTRL